MPGPTRLAGRERQPGGVGVQADGVEPATGEHGDHRVAGLVHQGHEVAGEPPRGRSDGQRKRECRCRPRGVQGSADRLVDELDAGGRFGQLTHRGCESVMHGALAVPALPVESESECRLGPRARRIQLDQPAEGLLGGLQLRRSEVCPTQELPGRSVVGHLGRRPCAGRVRRRAGSASPAAPRPCGTRRRHPSPRSARR